MSKHPGIIAHFLLSICHTYTHTQRKMSVQRFFGQPPLGADPFSQLASPPYESAILQSYTPAYVSTNRTTYPNKVGWVYRPFDNVPFTRFVSEDVTWDPQRARFNAPLSAVPLLFTSPTGTFSSSSWIAPQYTNGATALGYPGSQNFAYYSIASPTLQFSATLHILRMRNTISIDFRFDYTCIPGAFTANPTYLVFSADQSQTAINYGFPLGLRLRVPSDLFYNTVQQRAPYQLPVVSANSSSVGPMPGFALPSTYIPISSFMPAVNVSPNIYPVLSSPYGTYTCSMLFNGGASSPTPEVFRGNMFMIPLATTYANTVFVPQQQIPYHGGVTTVPISQIGLQELDMVFSADVFSQGSNIPLSSLLTNDLLQYVGFTPRPSTTPVLFNDNWQISIAGKFSYVCDFYF